MDKVRGSAVYYMKEKGVLGGRRLIDRIFDWALDNKKVYVHGYNPIYSNEETEEVRENEVGRIVDISGSLFWVVFFNRLSPVRFGKTKIVTPAAPNYGTK